MLKGNLFLLVCFSAGLAALLLISKCSEVLRLISRSMGQTSDQLQENEPHASILCWVIVEKTTPHNIIDTVRWTWGQRCDKLILFGDGQNPEITVLEIKAKVAERTPWLRTTTALKYLHDHYLEDYQWFYKGNTDTYVIVENLRYLLTTYDPEIPISLGARFHTENGADYLADGPGYVMSKAALKAYAEVADKCEQTDNLEAALGKCMVECGIMLGDSRDELGKNRFVNVSVTSAVIGTEQELYPAVLEYPSEEGHLSKTSISFHGYKTSDQLSALEFFLYRLQLFGTDRSFEGRVPAPLPPDISSIPKEILDRFGHPDLH